MAMVIDCGNQRWAEEPPGPQTLALYERVSGIQPRRLSASKFSTFWRLKEAK